MANSFGDDLFDVFDEKSDSNPAKQIEEKDASSAESLSDEKR